MNNSENKLIKLIDILRKDSGINNAADAMEQLSLVLLLKYFYEVILVDSSKKSFMGYFKELFNSSNNSYSIKNEAIFPKFKNILSDVIGRVEPCESDFYDDSEIEIWKKVNSFLNSIPIKLRSEKILNILIFELDGISFGEELAEAYDVIVVKMINESISSGAFHSPKALVSAIVKVTKPSPGDSIYDPALGTGRFIVEAHKLGFNNSINVSNSALRMFGQDVSTFACLVATLNLLLNGIDVKGVSLGDSLLDRTEKPYDIILSGVPFGRLSDIDKYDDVYHGYSSNLEAMFLKHTMRKLAKGGKAALIVPDGVLFGSSSALVNLRRELLTDFNLHSILSLPLGTLAPYAGVKVSVIFFDRKPSLQDIWFYDLKVEKPLNKRHKIVDHDFSEFIDLFSLRSESAQSYLKDKKAILITKDLNLSFRLPSESYESNRVSVHDELVLIDEQKIQSDLLYSQLTRLLTESGREMPGEKIVIQELFKIKSGKSLKKSELKDEGEFPVYGANGIVGYYDEYNLDGGNIIIGRVGAQCGNIYFVKSPIWLTNNSFSVQLNSSLGIFMPYLAHALRSLKLNRMARGSAQPSISYASIKDIELTLPTYEKQVALSKYFDDIQSKNLELQKSLRLQMEKLSELTDHSISVNRIELEST